MTTTSRELATDTIGVIGGGQLAQMLAEAARQRGVALAVQCSSREDPAAALASRLVEANPLDAGASRELVAGCQGVTFENEWIDLDALMPLERQGVRFRPTLASLKPLVDKLEQRQLLR